MTGHVETAAKVISAGTIVVGLIVWLAARPSYASVVETSTEQAERVLKIARAELAEHKLAVEAARAAQVERDKALFELGVASFAAALEANPAKKRKASAGARAAYKQALTARDATPASAAALVQTTLEAQE